LGSPLTGLDVRPVGAYGSVTDASDRSLTHCILCGDDDLTEEHIVADWVHRAFVRSKKPRSDFSGTFIGPQEMRLSTRDPISSAKVVCRRCNNEWMSSIDNDAAIALKPLIQGRTDAVLGAEAQSAVSAWIFKSALIFDALQAGNDGQLASLRAGFARDRLAPSGCTIYAGPAPPVPFSVEDVPEVGGLALFGVRPTSGVANVTFNVRRADGTPIPMPARQVATPGYTVMLGRINAIISGLRAPIIPTPEFRFERLWPVSREAVTLTSVPPETAATEG
jgi:hypothetical protein